MYRGLILPAISHPHVRSLRTEVWHGFILGRVLVGPTQLTVEGKGTGGHCGRACEVIHGGGQAEGGKRERAEKLTWRVGNQRSPKAGWVQEKQVESKD